MERETEKDSKKERKKKKKNERKSSKLVHGSTVSWKIFIPQKSALIPQQAHLCIG
jgi:hypothetical protein